MKKIFFLLSVTFFTFCVSAQSTWTPAQKAEAAKVGTMSDSEKVVLNLRSIMEIKTTFEKIGKQNPGKWVKLPPHIASADVEVCTLASGVLRVRSTYENGSGLYITFNDSGLTFTASKFNHFDPQSEDIVVQGIFDGSNVTYNDTLSRVLGSDEVLQSHSWNILYQLFRDKKISEKKFNSFLYKKN